jgi:filamentous hemagglutinin
MLICPLSVLAWRFAVKDAKQNLSKAKDAYSAYKQDLVQQQAQLQALNSGGFVGIDIGVSVGIGISIDVDIIGNQMRGNHKNLNVSYSVYGATSDSLKGSISKDSSTSNSQQTKHNNTSLTAANINLNSTQDTLIKGANLHATNQLNINSKNLAVSSVQNKHKAKTRSQGASLGIGSSGVNSVGFHQAKSDKNSKTVLLTSITAKQVNITTQDHTQLTGSLIAATDTSDKDGNDNGQLSLTTNSLSASSLNTTSNNKSSSIGFDITLSNSNPAQTGKNGNTTTNNINNTNNTEKNNKNNKTNKTQNSTSINNAFVFVLYTGYC